MEKIERVIYRAYDGTEFSSIDLCADHEKNCLLVDKIIDQLIKTPDDSDFGGGAGYIQHDLNNVLKVRTEFLEFCKRYISTKHDWIQQAIDRGFDVHWSYPYRILSEVLPPHMNHLANRFYCIDDKGREWGQPYFALNPEKGTQIKLG